MFISCDKNTNSNCKMLTVKETECEVCENTLYYLHNNSVHLKLF